MPWCGQTGATAGVIVFLYFYSMAAPKKYRMDKTAFKIQTFEEADDAMRDYSNFSLKERLRIYWHLTSIAYKFDLDHPPRMDKTVFQIKNLED